MIDLMCDIETLGKGSGYCVTAIAITPFNMNGQPLEFEGRDAEEQRVKSSFKMELHIGEQMALGYKVDFETLAWWMKQDAKIRKEMFSGMMKLDSFRKMFIEYFEYITKTYKTYRIWATAPKLDFGCIMGLFEGSELQYPILYSAERCARTLRETTKLLVPEFKLTKPEKLHDAEDDCKRQIADVQNAYFSLRSVVNKE